MSFAGTQLVVQLGRGTDYAWSATSASNDLVDIVAERLCTTNGSKPTIRSTHYRTRGPCVAMNRHVHTEDTTPNATAPGPAQHYEFLVLRTRHGIVQTRTTVNGRPVAIVLQRSTYRHEVDSLAGFARFNNPRRVKNATDFQRAANAIDYTFNWFYTDDRDIAHYSSGRLPVRAQLGPKLAHQLPAGIDDHPRLGRGSAWNGVAWYGYVNKDLRQLLGDKLKSPYTYSYCGRGRRAVCRDALRTSLRAAIARVLAEQGKASVNGRTYDKSIDYIRSVTASTVGTRPIDWQNRPTFQRVVAFAAHRRR